MEIHLSDAQQASQNDLARVQLGIDQLDRGEYLDEEGMNARFERMLRS